MSDSNAWQIALLRGINVGGRNRLPMADLRAAMEGLGLQDVQTHIQSGNAVFRGPGDCGPRIAAAIEDRFGFCPQVMVIDAVKYRGIVADNPFAAAGSADGASVHIGFLAQAAQGADRVKLAELAAGDEAFHLTDTAFYLHAPSGIGRSKLAARAEKQLGVAMTMRNQRVAEAVANLLAKAP